MCWVKFKQIDELKILVFLYFTNLALDAQVMNNPENDGCINAVLLVWGGTYF